MSGGVVYLVSHAEQDERDIRRYEVSRRDRRKILRLVAKLLREVGRTGGSRIDPYSVIEALQCVGGGRVVQPGSWGISLYPHNVVPVPPYVWEKVAWAHIYQLGVMWQTRLALAEAGISYVGSLLLYSEEELGRLCNKRAMSDILRCLKESFMRLPTAAELAHAREAGFWVEVDGLRVAKYLAPLEEILYIRGLRGDRPGFFDWAQMITLGDLLAKPEGRLWEEYVFTQMSGDGSQLSQKMVELLRNQAVTLADATVDWVRSAGLEFADQ